jgi:hypothetical protein
MYVDLMGFSLYLSFFSLKGVYTVNLDGAVSTGDGWSERGNALFNVTLFSQYDLNPLRQHTITLMNTPVGNSGALDLNYILIESGDGESRWAR